MRELRCGAMTTNVGAVETVLKHRDCNLVYEEKGWQEWDIKVLDGNEIELIQTTEFYAEDGHERVYCEDCQVVVEGWEIN